MWAHVDVQDSAMRVPQGQLHLRIMLMSGAVCQRHDPDLTEQATDEARKAQGKDRYGEGKGAARTHKGGEDMGVPRRGRGRERTRIGPLHSSSLGRFTVLCHRL